MVPFEPGRRGRRGVDLVSGPDAARTRMLLLEMIGGLGGIARGVTGPLIAHERRRAGMDTPAAPEVPQPYAAAAPAPAAPPDEDVGALPGATPEAPAAGWSPGGAAPEPLKLLARRRRSTAAAVLKALGMLKA